MIIKLRVHIIDISFQDGNVLGDVIPRLVHCFSREDAEKIRYL